MSEPLVSVVVPCYNHEKYVQDCIRSIIGQGYQNIELIIIDDGSKDGSVGKIQELMPECQQRFVRFEFRVRSNKGLCATLNEAISWCEGEYYSAIASDDIMLPHKTGRQVQHFIDNPECDAVFGGVNIVDDGGKVVRIKKSKSGTFKFEELFLVKHSLAAPTQMLRLACLKAAGEYPVGFYIEDFYMWLRMTSLGSRIDDVGEILANYRRHDSNISASLNKMNAARAQLIDMYSEHRLYKQAQASSELSAAMDMQAISKFSSIAYILRAATCSLMVFFDLRFYRYLIKFLIPNKLFR